MIANTAVVNVRKWWNWQTHHLEGVAPKGVGVQIPPSAPLTNLYSISYKRICQIVQKSYIVSLRSIPVAIQLLFSCGPPSPTSTTRTRRFSLCISLREMSYFTIWIKLSRAAARGEPEQLPEGSISRALVP